LCQKIKNANGFLPQDSSNRFHGFNEISLDPKADPNLVATDPTLGWRVNSIKGYFVNGYLEGSSYVQLQVFIQKHFLMKLKVLDHFTTKYT